MKKVFIISVFCILLAAAIVGHRVLALQNVQMKDSDYGMNMYTPAFPLVYEDLKEKIVKGKIEFVDFKSSMTETLDRLETPENRLSEEYYYKTIVKKSLASKKKIEKDIKEKFDEKSSILDTIQWEPENKLEIILYSMVKKDVEFLKPFEILDPMAFNDSDKKFKYFGTKDETSFFSEQTKPLFYKNENNYAVSLKTKTGDEIILYMTDDMEKKSVHKLWGELKKKITNDNFKEDDNFFAPFVEIKEIISYDELAGKEIKGTDYKIGHAIESVEFSLDNNGAKLKNEALLMLETCALHAVVNPRHFYFNKPFVLFIKEQGRENPYFMVKIKDTKYLVKE